MARTGRPSTYDPERHPLWAEGLAKLGKTDQDIADNFGISRSTLLEWKKAHPELSVALKIGKSEADTNIEQKLYQRATGYTYQEKKVVELPDGSTRKEITEKEVAPDVTAQIFWLKNRKPEEWRDKQERDVRFPDGLGFVEIREAKRDA